MSLSVSESRRTVFGSRDFCVAPTRCSGSKLEDFFSLRIHSLQCVVELTKLGPCFARPALRECNVRTVLSFRPLHGIFRYNGHFGMWVRLVKTHPGNSGPLISPPPTSYLAFQHLSLILGPGDG